MKKENYKVFTDHSHKSVDLFLEEVEKTSPLTNEEEYELWKKMKAGDMSARDKLVEANLRYVVKEAKQYVPSGVPQEDLMQAGSMGLLLAADKFDGERGVKFLSYAKWYVLNEIRKEANTHIGHKCLSLDELRFDDNGTTWVDCLYASNDYNPDSQLRYDMLQTAIQAGVEKKVDLGNLLADYLDMMEAGYSKSDFAKKHQLSNAQMKWFVDAVETESRNALRSAA